MDGYNWGFPKIKGTFLGGPNSKDYSILGVYIRVPLFWETTNWDGWGGLCLGAIHPKPWSEENDE